MTGKSKQTQTQTSALTPTSQKTYDALSGKVAGLLDGAGYKPYSGDLSAGPNALTQQAGQAVSGLLDYKPQQVTAQSFDRSKVEAMMDPELENVVSRSLQGVERNRQMQQVADAQSATAAGAWNGSRHGVADALTNEAALRTAGDMEASLRSQAYKDALAQYNQDASRDLSAQQFNSNLGLSGAQFGLGAAGLLGNLGLQQQQLDQGALDRQYQEFLRGQNAPYQQAQGYLGLLGATPWQTTTTGTSTQKSGGGLLNFFGNNLALAGQAMTSDRRLKDDIEHVETDAKGRRWYTFTYKDDPERKVQRGVMAQDLLAENPDHPAVSTDEAGFYRVDYGMLN